MPYLKMTTNVAIDAKQSEQLNKQFSGLMAKETGKPERYVMIESHSHPSMLFAGSTQPLAYLECKSIGLSPAQAKAISAAVCKLLGDTLSIPNDRVYIEFSNCPGEFWGWNATTFG